MDFPGNVPAPITIHSWCRFTAGWDCGLRGERMTAAAITWPSANRAIYIPMQLPFPYPVKNVFWCNGSTASGNVVMGVYTADGAKIYATASTAQSGTTALQFVAPGTPFMLPPGRYYLAFLLSATTANLVQGNTATVGVTRGRMTGILQEDPGSTSLPATMTPAVLTSFAFPLCGITRVASPAF